MDLYIDADSLLYMYAFSQQSTITTVRHTPSGREKQFKNKTLAKDFIKSWVAEDNDKRSECDFEIEQTYELTGDINLAGHLFDQRISSIAKDVNQYKKIGKTYVCIQGEGNYRKAYPARFVKYKENRKSDKPILFEDLYWYVKHKYNIHCIVVDGEETDDFVCRKVYEGNVVAMCDKDIVANSVGWLYNYQHNSFFNNTDEMRWNKFCMQLLTGDATDNIDGIKIISEQDKKHYDIPASRRSVGDATAKVILSTVETEKDALRAILSLYENAYPDDGKERFKEMAFFLWMARYKGQMFDVIEYMEGL